MKLADRGRVDDGAALEELFANLPVTADWTVALSVRERQEAQEVLWEGAHPIVAERGVVPVLHRTPEH